MTRYFSAVALIAVLAAPAAAQPTQASHESPAVRPPAASRPAVTFAKRAASRGDQATQTVTVDLRLRSTARSGAKVLEQSDAHLRRDQERIVTTTELGPHGQRSATVEYRRAQRTVNEEPPVQEPVVGKTYRCTRDGDSLLITDMQGIIPPLAEYKIVASNMETLGRPNPLANFFHGRTVRLGEQIELPIELAAEVLGFEKQFAAAKSFKLTLESVAEIDGQRCAVFDTEIEAGSGTTGQMGMIVDGPMAIQIDTCRAVSADLMGPIGMSESRSSPTGGSMQVFANGKLRVTLRSTYSEGSRRAGFLRSVTR